MTLSTISQIMLKQKWQVLGEQINHALHTDYREMARTGLEEKCSNACILFYFFGFSTHQRFAPRNSEKCNHSALIYCYTRYKYGFIRWKFIHFAEKFYLREAVAA